MYVSIRHLQAALAEALDQLTAATGNDAFLSREDMEKLLSANSALYDFALLNDLFELARATESNPSGRVTRADLERVADLVTGEILPEFRLLPDDLSPQAQASLSAKGDAFVRVARSLKNKATARYTFDLPALLDRLRYLVVGLQFNEFHLPGSEIGVHQVPGDAWNLDPDTFLTFLEKSGDRQWEDLRQRVGELREGQYAHAFLAAFPNVQTAQDRHKAVELVDLWLMYFNQRYFYHFDNAAFETSYFFLTGTTPDGQLVFLDHTYPWP